MGSTYRLSSFADSNSLPRPSRDSPRSEHHISPVWQTAIDKYYAELRRGGIRRLAVDGDLWSIDSPDGLIRQVQSLVPATSQLSVNWRRLESALLSLNDFAAVITPALGMDIRVAAVIWGSIRLILKVN